MSCDSPKLRRAASRCLITDNSMASGSPSRSEIPKYMFGIPQNILGTPLRRDTESTLLPTGWQQTYTPNTPYNAAAHPISPHSFHQLTKNPVQLRKMLC